MHVRMGVCYLQGQRGGWGGGGGEGYANLEACPKCGLAQYKDVGQAKEPNKVLQHFPFIP
jgi:hypothetical protein